MAEETVPCTMCGLCCIAISITELGKPVGVRCKHLTPDMKCGLYGQPSRPEICGRFEPTADFCPKPGESTRQAYGRMIRLERITAPSQ